MMDAETSLNNFLKAEARPYAVHEAGHAVVAHRLNGYVLFVEMDSLAQHGGETSCKPFADKIEDLAVCVAGCGAEHLLEEFTRRKAKKNDVKRMRKLLSTLSK